MAEFYTLNAPAETYNIEITNEEIRSKVEEIKSLRDKIIILNDEIRTKTDKFTETNKALLILYLQQQFKPILNIEVEER